MRNLFKTLSLSLLLFLSLTMCLAQETGKVTFMIHPPDATLKVDTMTISERLQPVELPAGTYRVQVWGPTLTYIDSTLTVIPDTTILYKGFLKHSDEWKAWEDERIKAKRPLVAGLNFLGLSVGMAAGGIIWRKTNNNFMVALEEEAETIREDYYNAISESETVELRERYEQIQKKHNRRNFWGKTGTGISISSAIFFTGYSIYQISKYRKNKPGPFKDTSPLSRLKFDLYYGQNQGFEAQIGYTF